MTESAHERGLEPSIRISGGAGPFEAAAIAAVIQRVLDEERVVAQTPGNRRRVSDWVAAGRREPFLTPRVPATRPTRRAAERS